MWSSMWADRRVPNQALPNHSRHNVPSATTWSRGGERRRRKYDGVPYITHVYIYIDHPHEAQRIFPNKSVQQVQ